jgi:hypothetical protein
MSSVSEMGSDVLEFEEAEPQIPTSTSSREGLFIKSTSKNYESHLKKFCEHFNAVFNRGVPRELLNDEKMSQYFCHLRTTNVSVS